MREWPKDGSTVNFRELVDPVCDAIDYAYILQRINKAEAIPWDGFDIGERELVGSFSPDCELSAENLGYDEEDQGRGALRVIIAIAVQLGIEQGRRMAKREMKHDLELFRILHPSIEGFLKKYT